MADRLKDLLVHKRQCRDSEQGCESESNTGELL
jgi:hypothetical protein